MNKEWKQKWVKALRSGNYEQTKGLLAGDCGYCCLGVLSDIVDPDETQAYKGSGCVNVEMYYYIPATVYQATDISPKEMGKCVDLNDKQSYTFGQIADYIEENL